jgi:hypothetical protein
MEFDADLAEDGHPAFSNQKVPITFDGFEIGNGVVSSDGTHVIFSLNDSPVSREIQAKLTSGLVDGMSINPRITKQKRVQR